MVVLALTCLAFLGVIVLAVVVAVDAGNDRDAVCEAIDMARDDNRSMWLRTSTGLAAQGADEIAQLILVWLDDTLRDVACIDGKPVEVPVD
jgi:hypothetical protein